MVVAPSPDKFDVALLHEDIPGGGAEVPHPGLGEEAAAVEILQPAINISQAGRQSSSSHLQSADLTRACGQHHQSAGSSQSSYQLQQRAVQSCVISSSSSVLQHQHCTNIKH